jgi:hypothetical protein
VLISLVSTQGVIQHVFFNSNKGAIFHTIGTNGKGKHVTLTESETDYGCHRPQILLGDNLISLFAYAEDNRYRQDSSQQNGRQSTSCATLFGKLAEENRS